MPSSDTYYFGTFLNLSATTIPGYDTFPAGYATINEVTVHHWDIDIGADGTVEYSNDTSSTSLLLEDLGLVRITLTVIAFDAILPSHPQYNTIATASRIISVVPEPTKASIDVYTDRGGHFLGEASDPYGPQEQVTLYGNVTYNGVPVENKDVSFEIRDANNQTIGLKTARSDENGVAVAYFRLPWTDESPESLFGRWSVVATVDVSEVEVIDTVPFIFDYLVKILDHEIKNQNNLPSINFARGSIIRSVVTIKNIRSIPLPVVLAMTIYDEVNVAINAGYISVIIPANNTSIFSIDLVIPQYAYIGFAEVNANAFSSLPSSMGVPYCPDTSETIIITEA
jgi:hypothetical protein